MSNEIIQQIFEETIEKMRKDKFPLGKDIKPIVLPMSSKRILGRCRYKRTGVYLNTRGRKYEYSYQIFLNEIFMKNAESQKDAIQSVLTHELIHTIDGCHNHKARFKAYAQKANNLYPNIHVSTTATNLEVEQFHKETEKDAKYIAKCQSCGKRILFFRKTKAISSALEAKEMLSTCNCQKRSDMYIHNRFVTSLVIVKNLVELDNPIVPPNFNKKFELPNKAPQKYEQLSLF